MKECYYRNQQVIDSMRQDLEAAAAVFTRNHAKVLAVSSAMTPTITVLQSLYDPEGIQEVLYHIRKQTVEELDRILDAIDTSVFSYRPTSMDVYRSLITRLHFNNYLWDAHFSRYVPKNESHGDRYRRSPKDIEVLERQNLEFFNACLYYVKFDGKKFVIDEDKFQQFVDRNSFFVTNKRQNEFLEKALLVSKCLKEMGEMLGKPVSGYYSEVPNYAFLNAMISSIK